MYERNFGTAAEERYSSESSRDFEVFIEVQAEVGGGCAAKNRLIKSMEKTHAVLYGRFNLYNVPFIYR